MTWRELQLAALKKCFAYDENDAIHDDLADPYRPQMALTANEGMLLLTTAGRFLQRCLCLPTQRTMRRVELRELTEDFFMLDADEMYLSTASGWRRADGVRTEGESALWLPGCREDGQWLVYYLAYPPRVTDGTEPDRELELPPEAAAILPLYMASQLYKDDDLSLAQLYRQEFDIGLEYLRRTSAARRSGRRGFDGGTGWW